MNGHSEAVERRHDGLADRAFHALWRLFHKDDLTPREQHEAMWTKLAELETAARELDALAHIEAARRRGDHDR